MKSNPACIADEKAKLSAGYASLSDSIRDALALIRNQIPLDIFGLDCALLPNEQVLVFEANPNMSFFPMHDDPVFNYNRDAIEPARAGVRRLLQHKQLASK